MTQRAPIPAERIVGDRIRASRINSSSIADFLALIAFVLVVTAVPAGLAVFLFHLFFQGS